VAINIVNDMKINYNKLIAKQFMTSINVSVECAIVVEQIVDNQTVIDIPTLVLLTSSGKPRCRGLTKSGNQCKYQGSCSDNKYCKTHNKD
jgi:hypothetical protein